jgi:type VI secretion system protein VasD
MKIRTMGVLGAWLSAMLLFATGCTTAPDASSGIASTQQGTSAGAESTGLLSSMADKGLIALGIKKPELPETANLPKVPDSALPDWKVAWRLAASDSLNVDENGQSLALIVRFYKLRSPDAFLQAPYDTFGDPAKEKAVLNEDLIAARELQLIPGQHYEATDKVSREARYVGIVALYRKPVSSRWRYAFSTASVEKSGVNVGAHACAMSIQAGEAIGHSVKAVRSTAMACQ